MAFFYSHVAVAFEPPPPPSNPPTPVVTKIELSGPIFVNENASAQFECTASYSDGTSAVVSPVWSVDSSYASIDASGLFSALSVPADQVVTVSVTYLGKSASFSTTISDVFAQLSSLDINGPASVEEGSTGQYSCIAHFPDGTTQTVVPDWDEDSIYGSISASGLLTADNVPADQTLTVSASFGGLTSSKNVTLIHVADPVVVTGLTISGPAELGQLQSATFTCEAAYSDGSSEIVTPVWSENSAAASMDASGKLILGQFNAPEYVTVTASFSEKVATFSVSVLVTGHHVTFPLSGFEGKRVKANLYDSVTEEWYGLGELESPQELMVGNVNPEQWYWLSIVEWNTAAGVWENVYAGWLYM
ncbi:MAG: hypothetical protein OES84_00595 [Kiritimatiellaceae bacterium]|nr:hypothetical protein [Kiritimatiellaceae bacterium]